MFPFLLRWFRIINPSETIDGRKSNCARKSLTWRQNFIPKTSDVDNVRACEYALAIEVVGSSSEGGSGVEEDKTLPRINERNRKDGRMWDKRQENVRKSTNQYCNNNNKLTRHSLHPRLRWYSKIQPLCSLQTSTRVLGTKHFLLSRTVAGTGGTFLGIFTQCVKIRNDSFSAQIQQIPRSAQAAALLTCLPVIVFVRSVADSTSGHQLFAGDSRQVRQGLTGPLGLNGDRLAGQGGAQRCLDEADCARKCPGENTQGMELQAAGGSGKGGNF